MPRRRKSFARTLPGLRRRLRLEPLESRLLMAGDTYLINYQLTGVPTPTRYLADVGEIFGSRGGGLSYGWSSLHTDVSRDRDINDDQRLDTLIHFHAGQTWELAVPNGQYEVTVSIGDAENPSTHTLNVEGVEFWDAEPLLSQQFRAATQTITVNDGRLTLDQGTAIDKATRINYIHVVGLPNGLNAAPAPPTITEPAVNGQVVNPGDVHMEASGFSDPDGNAHKSTDWEIWSTGPGAAPVWQTLGITGVERLHTHQGDGVFIGTHAGRTTFLNNTDYDLRVRFRDDAGAVSDYETRAFQTGVASVVFPMEIEDVDSAPAPLWRLAGTISGSIILPNSSPNRSSLRLESASGGLLLSITAFNGGSNSVVNPAPLEHHVEPRVVITAGSAGLTLGESNLSFVDEDGELKTIFIPAFSLAANQRLDLWVASNGATYFGTAAQTAPVFTSLARSGVSFSVSQPGYVIEEVAGDLQLPTNIAFVPNPGPNPSDPLFYVTELYGTIKVVRRNFTVSDYATDLLNFNPTGAFPGSGEQGLTGIAVDPLTGDVFASRVTATNPAFPEGDHHPQVVRFTSADGGLTAATTTVIRNMVGETQGQSHQISNVTIGPDGMLYVHNGDGFDYTTAANLDSYRGKVLRMNLDGSAPMDNPFYSETDGINARDYVYAYGLRNPFGGAWRTADGRHYEVENGPSIDRFARILPGESYGWNNTDASMTIKAIYNWNPAVAPVNLAFIQQSTFAGSLFPPGMMDRAFVSESGSTYAEGQQPRGKRITYFQLDANGVRLSGPTTLVRYVGTGFSTVVGLAAGPDGLYFTELYKEFDAESAIDRGARVFRVRYVNRIAGDTDFDADVDGADFLKWQRTLGSTTDLAADFTASGVVDATDLTTWRTAFPSATAVAAAASSLNATQTIGESAPLIASAIRSPLELTAPLTPRREPRDFRANDAAHVERLTDRRTHKVSALPIQIDSELTPANSTRRAATSPDKPQDSDWLDLIDECFARRVSSPSA